VRCCCFLYLIIIYYICSTTTTVKSCVDYIDAQTASGIVDSAAPPPSACVNGDAEQPKDMHDVQFIGSDDKVKSSL
jgi:hypothetical protein